MHPSWTWPLAAVLCCAACGGGSASGDKADPGEDDDVDDVGDDTGEPVEDEPHDGPWGTGAPADADKVIWGGEGALRLGVSLAWVDDFDGSGASEVFVGDYAVDGTGGSFLFDVPLPVESSGDDALARASGGGTSTLAGWSVGSIPDTDGDGLPELLSGSPTRPPGGEVWWLTGPVSGLLASPEGLPAFVGGGENDKVGFQVGGGDLDGDGVGDLSTGAPGWDPDGDDGVDHGAVMVRLGPISGTMASSDADLALLAGDLEIDLGYSHVFGDLDGDGFGDIVAGAPLDDTAGTNRGAAWLLFGPSTGLVDVDDLSDVITGTEHEEECGTGVAVLDDLDGDGLGDVAIGCPRAGDQAGRVFVVSGTVSGQVDREVALVTVESTEDHALVGTEIYSGDADGDGAVDLLLCSEDAEGGSGAVWLFYGPLSGALTTEDAGYVVRGVADESLGSACLFVDEDGDDLDDLVVGARRAADEGGEVTGAVFVFSGGLDG